MNRTVPASINDRSEARKAANGRGRIVLPDQSVFFDCTILDTSISGAHIRLRRKAQMPDNSYLLNVRDRTVHRANVVWEKGEHLGLRFTETHILGSELPHDLDFMRKHWLECAMR